MIAEEIEPNLFSILIEGEEFFHQMNFGGNRNWTDQEYRDRATKIDRILEMNPGD